jgi:hypothetical protein
MPYPMLSARECADEMAASDAGDEEHKQSFLGQLVFSAARPKLVLASYKVYVIGIFG